MADQLYGLTAADVQRLRRLLDSFESGALNQRPRHRRKGMHWNSAGTASIFSSITSKLDGRDWLNDDAMQQPSTFYTHPVDDDGVIGAQAVSSDRPYNPSLFPMPGDVSNTLYPVLEDASGLQWFIPLWSQRCINILFWHMYGTADGGGGGSNIALNGTTVPLPENLDYILSSRDGGWWEFDHSTDKVTLTKPGYYICVATAEFNGAVSSPPEPSYIVWSDSAGSFALATRGYVSFATTSPESHSATTMQTFIVDGDNQPVTAWLTASLASGVNINRVNAFIFPFGFGETR